MILPMSRVQIVGAQDALPDVLRLLLDFGRVHLDETPLAAGLARSPLSSRDERESRQLRRILEDAEVASRLLRVDGVAEPASPPTRQALASWARQARRIRREAERLDATESVLDDERALLQKHRGFLELFGALLGELAEMRQLSVYGLTLPGSEAERLEHVAENVRKRLGKEISVTARKLPSGDLAVLIAVPREVRGQMEKALAGAGVPEIPLPPAYAGQTLGEAAPRMLQRLTEIPDELEALKRKRAALALESAAELRRIRAGTHDRLSELEAAGRSAVTAHAFALEGWLPSADVKELKRRTSASFGNRVIVAELAREQWRSREAPVVLSNPRLFKPFELLTGLMPLPRYGTIDPTPFVAVTFPMLFGMILGDVGYGLLMVALALLLRMKARPGPLRTIAEIALPCGAFAIIFGVLYGEYFGNLGRLLFGLHAPLIDREEAVIASALIAIGIGLAHVLLGLVLGIVTAMRGEPRVAVSRTVQLLMLVLVVLAILAAVEVLPSRLFSPFGIAVLVGFPVLLALEGIVAPIEFFSTVGNVLSYVRIMAIGTASVMLAVVANQMVGVFGSALVGVLFAMLFHVVNFALGLFSPTIHALRLHYVEFFRQFYSGGGQQYQPFAHWRPDKRGAA